MDQDKIFLAKGKRGIVSLSRWKGRKAVAKRLNPRTHAKTALADEAKFLKECNRLRIGPKLFHHDGEMVVMQYVPGMRILEFFESAAKKEIVEVCISVLKQCRKLDAAGINKNEMANPYKHILVSKTSARKPKAVMIDFERCQYSKKPKNVTQFVQFLTSGKVKHAVSGKVSFDETRMRELAKQYKSGHSAGNSEKKFKEIVHSLQSQ